jgi:putative CocE/NonD family hydrolase
LNLIFSRKGGGKMKRRIILVLFALVLALGWVGTNHAPGLISVAHAEELVSAPGKYSGYSPALYDGYKLFSQYVTVRDGTKLAVDYFRPTLNGQVVNTPLPVVWMHTPYQRRNYPSNSTNLAAALYPGAALGLVRYGYVVGVVDARGLYASYGIARGTYNKGEWLDPAVWDAYDITEWFAAQAWSDGNIGMWGCSATGGTQLQAASTMPPHLNAIFPMSCGFDSYLIWSKGGMSKGTVTPPPPLPGAIPARDAFSVPVDEDPSGTMMKEAWEQHRYDIETGYIPFRNSVSPWLGVQWWPLESPYMYLDYIQKSGIAIYNAGNWEELYNYGAFFLINNLANPSKLVLGPGTHCIWWTEYSPKPYPLTFPIVNEELRWFDYWLKGIQNGIMDEPPIYFFTYNAPAGQDWRFAWQWPLPSEKRTDFYLGAGPSGMGFGVNDGTLSTTPPAMQHAKDVYPVDYGITAANRAQKGLTYTTAPLTADLEITGHPVLHLWISSTAADADFLAYLEDIAPDGTARSFSENGKLRASHRATQSAPYKNFGLPWHRSNAEDIMPLSPGQPVELVFDIWPTSYIFKAGHRIRLNITCFDAVNTPVLDPAPTVSIYRNHIYRSHITLPIGGAPVGAYVRIEPEVLNLHSHGEFTALITFPRWLDKGYVKDINLSSIQCNGASAVSAKLHKGILIAKFNRHDVIGKDAGHKVKLTVTGEFGNKFNYGPMTFEGSDTVRVLRKWH